MKIKDVIKVPVPKPRDPNHAVLSGRKGGPMRDKRHELKRGETKHKGKMCEGLSDNLLLTEAEHKDLKKFVSSHYKLGERVKYTSYSAWKKDLPPKATFDRVGDNESAFSRTKDFEGRAGAWNHEDNTGWIYEHYLNKSNYEN